MQLVIGTQHVRVEKRNNCFYISDKKRSRMISPLRVTSIAITQQCTISSAAILLAAEHEIPILFFNRTGRAKARLWSPYFGSIATIRRRQAEYAHSPEATQWIIDLLKLKLEHQTSNLRYMARLRPAFADKLEAAIYKMNTHIEGLKNYHNELLADCGNSIIGIEGSIARAYWQAVAIALPEQYRFDRRSRRPAQDKFNAALNYLYGMLYGIIEGACLATGLDPYLGFLHTDRHRQATFTFDLIEPFRPWVDELLLTLIFQDKLRAKYFKQLKGDGVVLDKPGKQVIIPAFNAMMQQKRIFKDHDLKTKHHIHLFAGEFSQYLLNKKIS